MPTQQQVIKLIKRIQKFNGNGEIDICQIDGCGCEYLIGYNELRHIGLDGKRVYAESNNVHEVDEDGNEIEGCYRTFFWDGMTDYERDTIFKYLTIFYKKFRKKSESA